MFMIPHQSTDMDEVAELADISPGSEEVLNDDSKNEEEKDEDIEIALEIVELEMGNVLEELKSNVDELVSECDDKIEVSVQKKASKKLFQGNFSVQRMAQSKDTLYRFSQNSLVEIPNTCSYRKTKKTIRTQEIQRDTEKTARPIYQVRRFGISKKETPSNSSSSEICSCMCLSNSSSIRQKFYRKRSNTRRSISSSSTIDTISRSTPITRLPKTPEVIEPINHEEVLNEFQKKVNKAIEEKKTFTVCGNYYSVRKALLSRGWVEKMRIYYNTSNRDQLKKLLGSSVQELILGMSNPKNGSLYKRMITTKLLGQHQVDFYWDSNCDCFQICSDKVKQTIINRFRKGIFNYTSKEWLCKLTKNSHWYQQSGFCWMHHPRSYNLSNIEDPKDFVKDFKFTAALSMLKWIVRIIEMNTSHWVISEGGKIPINAYEFACQEVTKSILRCRHEDIDFEVEEAMDFQWNEFLEHYYQIVHIGNHFKTEPPYDEPDSTKKMYERAKKLLQEVEVFHPELPMDGLMNIWILKPTNGCRGEGIYLCRTLQYILKIIKSNLSRTFIVQKYIEKPLLIYNTKFDIRIWFLISCAHPLTVWIYKDFYVRFSSQLYNLRRLHESVHLTNNSVQSRYKNCIRDSNLPSCNMWDSHQFQKYLSDTGKHDVYKDVIFPGIKECLIAAILMNQKNMEMRKNSFELYGSDFMIGEDYKPWLLEINSRPALYPSTPVTTRLCPQLLDDVIKVVIDRPKNLHASIGSFQLLYKEKIEVFPKLENEKACLKVIPLNADYFCTPQTSKEGLCNSLSVPCQTNTNSAHLSIKEISADMKLTLQNLLALINREREKRNKPKNELQIYDLQEIYANKDIKDSDSNKTNDSQNCLVEESKVEKLSLNSDMSCQKAPYIKKIELNNNCNQEKCEELKQSSTFTIFRNIMNSIRSFRLHPAQK